MWLIWGLGIFIPIMENQMEKKIEHDVEIGSIGYFKGSFSITKQDGNR